MKQGLALLAHYVIVVSVVKNCSDCVIEDKVVAIIQDNRGEIDLVQKVDIDKVKRLKIG